MLMLALFCLIIALLAGAFGFTGLAAGALGVAKFLIFVKILFFVFVLAFVGFLLAHLRRAK
jgi:uncharacterized membrane protein YtjA (UPF0391 family)